MQDQATLRREQAQLTRSLFGHISDSIMSIVNEVVESFQNLSESQYTIQSRTSQSHFSQNLEVKPLSLPIINVEEGSASKETPLSLTNDQKICSICMDKDKAVCFSCGHLTCDVCCEDMIECPFCKAKITIKIKLFMC